MLLRGGARARSNLGPCSRELRQAIKGERPEPFGIRRLLDEDAQKTLKMSMGQLICRGQIPSTVIPRQSLSNTLLPQSRLSKQLGRGIVIGYEFAKRQQAAKESVLNECPENLVVKLGGAMIIQGRTVALELISNELDQEHEDVDAIFEEVGIVRPENANFPPHVSLGDAKNFMSKAIQGEVVKALNSNMPIGENVILLPIDFYNGNQDALI